MDRFDRIIKESIDRFVNEAFQSSKLRDLYHRTPKTLGNTGRRSLGGEVCGYSVGKGGPGRRGLYADKFLDKISDDMIADIGKKNELSQAGYRFGIDSSDVYDKNGNRRYAFILNNGTYVIFKNDPETLQRLETLSNGANDEYIRRKHMR